ncbi:MAG: superoxide dismutase, partial [Firmicutes bacterium]|nr:superoxide dismutase [Bacillota bacterium]
MNNNHYPFELVPLPYAYNALEPYIDEKTMQLHHDRHLQTYVNNLNAALKNYPDLHNWSLEQLLYYSDILPLEIRTAVINNGGGVFNHNNFFAGMISVSEDKNQTAPNLMNAINSQFGSFDEFKKQFKNNALSVFGSGYTWLASDNNGKLQIVGTKNQDTILPMN